MKRFITLLLVAILVVASMSVVAFAATVEAEKGATIEVPVTVKGDDDGIAGFKVKLSDTPYLTIESIRVENDAATINHNKKIVVWSAADNVPSVTIYVKVTVSNSAEIGQTYNVGAEVSQASKKVDPSVDNDGVADGTVLISGSASGFVKIICKHSYDAVVTQPTCTERGYTTYTCACGDTYVDNYVDATGHSFDDWSVTKSATCTETGTKTRTCSVCGEVETDTIPATGHTAAEAVKENEVAATCGTDGSYDEVVYCIVCGEELSRETKTIPATGEHTYGEGVVTKAATCTEDGVMTFTCSVCGHTKTEAIPAGHTWGEWVVVKEATCTEDGLKTRTCSACGEVESEVIPSATAHVWSDWTVTKEATCTEDGERTRTCANCGKVETEVIKALGHDWSEWKVTKDATCTADGQKTRTCAHCDKVETEVIKAEGHNYKNGVCTKCGAKDPNYQPPTEDDGEKDDVPETGDITNSVFMTGALVLVLMAAAVAFVFKRRTAK